MKKNFIIRLRPVFLGIAAALFSIVIFFSAVEIGLRLAGFNSAVKEETKLRLLFQMGIPLRPVDPVAFGPYDRDRLLFWKLQPNEFDEVNAKGYRGVMRSYDKPNGVLRLIIIGDSCAYGSMAENKDTYAYLLEAKLNSLHKGTFEVINAGVPGYSSLQGLRYLRNELIKYHPDMVLVGFGFNDLCEAVGKKDSDIALMPSFFITINNKLSAFKFYKLLKQVTFRLKSIFYHISQSKAAITLAENAIPLDKMADLDFWVRAQNQRLAYAPTRRVPPEDFVKNINDIVDIGKKNNFSVILLTLPSIDDRFGYGPLLRLFSKKYNIPLIDLISEFKNRKANTQPYFIDNNHYNEEGHRLVAEIIFGQLQVLWRPVLITK